MPFTRRQSRLASVGTPVLTSPSTQHETATALPATTPKGKTAFSFLNSITHRQPKTPKDKSFIKPAEPEMHPQRDHRTSTTPYDEARWLGFFNMGTQTAPAAKTTSFTAAATSPTPTKFAHQPSSANVPASSPVTKTLVPSPEFKFTFRRAPSVELSEDAQKIMEESRLEAAKIRAQLASLPSIPDSEPDDSTQGRKIAKPKGKVGRFSDVHKQGFNKMDSITNHASAWRANPNQTKLAPASIASKPSPSKAELDKPLPPPSLKRSPSKPALKKVESNPFLTRSPSKLGLQNAQAEDLPQPSAKRVKQFRDDDAGTARPKDVASPVSSATTTPRHQTQGLVRTKSGLLRPGFSSAMSPTKSSMARTQGAKEPKNGSQIPALVRSNTTNTLRLTVTSALPRSKSMRDLNATSTPSAAMMSNPTTVSSPSPVKVAYLPMRSPAKAQQEDASMTESPSSSNTPRRIKSILRTPNRRYTRDPLKIAAGTHLATPPSKSELYPNVPDTEPIIKRVNFSNSTKEVEEDAVKAASVEPELIAYPELAITQDAIRRTTMATTPTIPGTFTFRSDREISFGSPKTGTIRHVRTSDVGMPPAFQFTGARAPDSPSKRKLDTLDETGEASEKENRGDDEEEHRPVKKARVVSGESKSAPATPISRKAPHTSKLPRFGSKRPAGLTAARLSMLARPKNRG